MMFRRYDIFATPILLPPCRITLRFMLVMPCRHFSRHAAAVAAAAASDAITPFTILAAAAMPPLSADAADCRDA